MKSFLTFLSLLAVGLILASLYVLVEKGIFSQTSMSGGEGVHLEYRSLTLGLVIGFILSALTRVSWHEIPKRMLSWIWARKEGTALEFFLVLLLLLIIYFV